MKRSKWILNSLILVVGIFFLTQAFSYAQVKRDEHKSKESTKALEVLAKGDSSKTPSIDFQKLSQVNPDIIGWIASDDLSIDYPLVQGLDNETYLYTDSRGDKNSLGAIFMDYRNQSLGDPFVLIYGHRTKNGTMFGPLASFTNKPKIHWFTYDSPRGSYRLRPVLGVLIPGQTRIDPRNFDDFSKRQEFYQEMKEKAVFDLGYHLQEEDHLVNLVTCSYEGKDLRLLLVTILEQ